MVKHQFVALGTVGSIPTIHPFLLKKMSLNKYLKNSLDYDLIYRSGSRNPLGLPRIEKSSFIVSHITSLPKILSSANTLKVISSSGAPKICLSSVSSNELSIKKGDPLSCTLVLSKKLTFLFFSTCSLAFSSVSPTIAFSMDLNQKVASTRFRSLSNFFSFAHYESSLVMPSKISCTFSIYSSKSIGLFSALFPYYVLKKKINSFRIIHREIE